jgi:hypothetical protein
MNVEGVTAPAVCRRAAGTRSHFSDAGSPNLVLLLQYNQWEPSRGFEAVSGETEETNVRFHRWVIAGEPICPSFCAPPLHC